MRIVIDTSACTGHGRCYAVSPGLFDYDDEGYGTVRTDTAGDAVEADALRAIASCPERAIEIKG